MKKSKLLIFGTIIALTMCSCGDETKAPITNDAVSISTLLGSFGVDVDSYAELAGDADYVFTGKVLEEVNVEYKWPVTIENEDGSTREVTTPYTTYNVENIENIKGVHIATSNGRFCGAKRPQCEANRPLQEY